MPKPVITVENLSKAYRIGVKEEVPDTLMSAMTGFMKAPLKKFHELRKLDTFRHSGDSEDIYWALKDVSFEVQEGEVLGVIGRNGAGKSTLLKILSRITEPTSGRAVIRGRVSSLLEVGTGFHPELSGRENVYLNGTILGMTKQEIDRKFDEIVDFSGVEKFLDTPIKRYSSGMKVRLAFAVAAHLEPEILIIDEVLAVGDAEFQKKCMGKMQDVAQGGRTVLFVSHNMAAVERLCSRGLLLSHGRLDYEGVVDRAISLYYDSLGSGRAHIGKSSAGHYIKAVRMINEDGDAVGAITPRCPLRFEIDVEVPGGTAAPVLGINILTPGGLRICTLSNAFSGEVLGMAGERATIRCEAENLLLPGIYALRLGYDDERGRNERIEDAVTIEVLDRAFCAGANPTGVHGIIAADSIWSRVSR